MWRSSGATTHMGTMLTHSHSLQLAAHFAFVQLKVICVAITSHRRVVSTELLTLPQRRGVLML